jgi:hypothetical protein
VKFIGVFAAGSTTLSLVGLMSGFGLLVAVDG